MQYYSQIKQDKWVLSKLGQKRNGVFIDVGAFDGVNMSNTYVLEKDFDWTGVCVECNPEVIPKLKEARTVPICERAVFNKGGVMMNFNCHESQELSALTNINTGITVETITLNDVITQYKLPRQIDYISLDVEGVELSILKTFHFGKYDVKCWTIEHNSCQGEKDENLREIMHILLSNNYMIKMHNWDLFAIKDDIIPEFPWSQTD